MEPDAALMHDAFMTVWERLYAVAGAVRAARGPDRAQLRSPSRAAGERRVGADPSGPRAHTPRRRRVRAHACRARAGDGDPPGRTRAPRAHARDRRDRRGRRRADGRDPGERLRGSARSLRLVRPSDLVARGCIVVRGAGRGEAARSDAVSGRAGGARTSVCVAGRERSRLFAHKPLAIAARANSS